MIGVASIPPADESWGRKQGGISDQGQAGKQPQTKTQNIMNNTLLSQTVTHTVHLHRPSPFDIVNIIPNIVLILY
jgi:hypothetical protein